MLEIPYFKDTAFSILVLFIIWRILTVVIRDLTMILPASYDTVTTRKLLHWFYKSRIVIRNKMVNSYAKRHLTDIIIKERGGSLTGSEREY